MDSQTKAMAEAAKQQISRIRAMERRLAEAVSDAGLFMEFADDYLTAVPWPITQNQAVILCAGLGYVCTPNTLRHLLQQRELAPVDAGRGYDNVYEVDDFRLLCLGHHKRRRWGTCSFYDLKTTAERAYDERVANQLIENMGLDRLSSVGELDYRARTASSDETRSRFSAAKILRAHREHFENTLPA